MPDNPLQAQLAQLQDDWLQRLRIELPRLAEQANALIRQPDIAPDALPLLRDQLHKLAGSAGTFGYPALGQAARELEKCCQELLRQSPADLSAWHKLASDVDHLQALLQPEEFQATPILEPTTAPERLQVGVLVIEDDGGLLADIDHTLSNYGYNTFGLNAPEQLAHHLQSAQLNALLIDISPGSSGAQLMPELTRLQAERAQPLPLLAISNQRDFATQLEAIRAGAVGFFPTPVDLIALEDCLNRYTQPHQDAAYRVLLVDDDQALAQRYCAVLQAAGMLVDWVQRPEALLDRLHDFHPDLVLMDIHMPDYSGIELAQLIRLNDHWLRIPIIYLSAETDSSQQLAALLKAGDDFVSKPISDQTLVATVYARAQRARLVSHALTRDSMTGLLKHADIKEQVELEVERARRQQLPVSIAMVDLDHFKRVNDNYGHAVGDTVIRALASLLRQRLRRIDGIGRYGGEEFVAVLPNCTSQDAQDIFDQIREAFAGLVFRTADGNFQCTFSAGISACEAPDWECEDLLEVADQRLYLAKRNGRNQVICRHQART
ncbi:diguanylate cyclase [Halopseudomonas salegens]|uniref:diguanylate cyclase n=1 Tax=Halopseudomonas salegens TaxID=1434072 RepID=A0A1H2HM44_9GAMM|nr:diguanylate cyclase [Halopseudomonas salegens]SDU32904.1 response regulator receiver modulated diguanylate cyclase [Halopseudomonas salegens]